MNICWFGATLRGAIAANKLLVHTLVLNLYKEDLLIHGGFRPQYVSVWVAVEGLGGDKLYIALRKLSTMTHGSVENVDNDVREEDSGSEERTLSVIEEECAGHTGVLEGSLRKERNILQAERELASAVRGPHSWW